jgi:hypothetical protein
MSNNVLIPRTTFERIIDMMECLDISRIPNYYDYLDVLKELKVKKQKLDIRETYAKVIYAGDSDSRHDARIEYLWQKSQIGNVDLGDTDF